MVLNSRYAQFWDNFCEKAPSKIINVKVRLFVFCVENDSRPAKHTHTHTHTHSLTDGSRAFCVAALFINLSGDVTSSNHLLFGGICPKTTSPSGATDSQYHTHKHTVPLGPPGIGFYPESHFLCLDMISVGNRKPSTFFSHDSRVACGLGAEAWLLSS